MLSNCSHIAIIVIKHFELNCISHNYWFQFLILASFGGGNVLALAVQRLEVVA